MWMQIFFKKDMGLDKGLVAKFENVKEEQVITGSSFIQWGLCRCLQFLQGFIFIGANPDQWVGKGPIRHL